jgi:hypothetical protein
VVEVAPRRRARRPAEGWIAAGLGAALAGGLAAALLRTPEGVVLPFPWLDRERAAQVAVQVDAAYLKIDRAAKTFFLLEGRFPESLARLTRLGLIGPADVAGPGGEPFVYAPREESYSLRVAGADDADAGGFAGATEAITGDFLLDPDFLAPRSSSQQPPLVLLD